MAGLLDAIRDPEFWGLMARQAPSNLLDAAKGNAAGLLGGPVDLATMAMRPFGFNVEAPVMGSEWIRQKSKQPRTTAYSIGEMLPIGVDDAARVAVPVAAAAGGLFAMHKMAGDDFPDLARALPSQIGSIRGYPSEYLSYDQILDVNKGRGWLTKAQRKGLYDPSSNVDMSQQLSEIGTLNREINDIRLSRLRGKSNAIDPLVLRSQQRGLLANYGHEYVKFAAEQAKNTGGIDSGFSAAFNKHRYDKIELPEIQKQERFVSRFMNSPSSGNWTKDRAEKIYSYAKAGIDATDEANSATLEAVVRNMRKLGWTTEHTSKSSGKSSSRYLISPDGGRKVRVSDHYLPDTPQREYNRSIGLGGKWDDEVVVDYQTNFDELINRVIGGNDG